MRQLCVLPPVSAGGFLLYQLVNICLDLPSKPQGLLYIQTRLNQEYTLCGKTSIVICVPKYCIRVPEMIVWAYEGTNAQKKYSQPH
ncbi:hypothetical protein D3C86_2078910 [compost metagenome]